MSQAIFYLKEGHKLDLNIGDQTSEELHNAVSMSRIIRFQVDNKTTTDFIISTDNILFIEISK